MHDFGLPERTVNTLLEYFRSKPYIEKVCIYGSRAKGNYRNGSDIDFAIWTDNHDKFTAIRWELDALPTPYSFDVTDYKILDNEKIKQSIDIDGKLFYKKKD